MNDEQRILILLFYYDRPELVKIAVNSIKSQQYTNWEVAFIDDSSSVPGEPIVRDILSDYLDKVTFYHTNDTTEQKLERNGVDGSVFGKYAQLAIEQSSAEYVIMLCDDDALYPEYFKNLNTYFYEHTDEHYVYSHIHTYDPLLSTIETELRIPSEYHHLNKTHALNPYFNIDMSQVAWRRTSFLEANIQFPYPMTVNLDAAIYIQMHSAFGLCKFSGFTGQFKAIGKGKYMDQLSHRMGKQLAGLVRDEEIYTTTVK